MTDPLLASAVEAARTMGVRRLTRVSLLRLADAYMAYLNELAAIEQFESLPVYDGPAVELARVDDGPVTEEWLLANEWISTTYIWWRHRNWGSLKLRKWDDQWCLYVGDYMRHVDTTGTLRRLIESLEG